jgi:hypothetical protein
MAATPKEVSVLPVYRLVDVLHEPQEHAIGLEHAAAVHQPNDRADCHGPSRCSGEPPLGAPWRAHRPGALLIFWFQMSSPVDPVEMYQMVCAMGSPGDAPGSHHVGCSVPRAQSRQWSLLTKFANPLSQRTASRSIAVSGRAAGKLVIALADANLVAREDAPPELVVEGAARRVCDIDGSAAWRSSPSGGKRPTLATDDVIPG